MKDVLEDDVPEKFYISSDKAQRLLESLNATYRPGTESDQIVKAGATPGYRRVNTVIDPRGVSPTLAARDYKDPLRVLVGGSCLDATVGFDGAPRVYEDIAPTLRAGRSGLMVVDEDDSKIMQIGNFVTTGNFRNPQRGRVYDPEGLAPTLNTAQGGGTLPHIIEPVCAASRGRNPGNPGDRTPGAETEQRLEVNREGLCNTITTVQKDNYILEPPFRIRRLTPRECWRLQGFTDEDFDRAAAGASNCQLYKMAGNSIAVPCLEAIFRNLLEGQHALLEVINDSI